jgi:hypothetical protein
MEAAARIEPKPQITETNQKDQSETGIPRNIQDRVSIFGPSP